MRAEVATERTPRVGTCLFCLSSDGPFTSREHPFPEGLGNKETLSRPASYAIGATTAGFQQTTTQLKARITHIKSGRPQTNGHIEALHRLILEECWRPAFARYLYPRYTGLKRELARYLSDYNTDRVHHGRLTNGRIPADIVYGARKMETR